MNKIKPLLKCATLFGKFMGWFVVGTVIVSIIITMISSMQMYGLPAKIFWAAWIVAAWFVLNTVSPENK